MSVKTNAVFENIFIQVVHEIENGRRRHIISIRNNEASRYTKMYPFTNTRFQLCICRFKINKCLHSRNTSPNHVHTSHQCATLTEKPATLLPVSRESQCQRETGCRI